MKNVSQMLNDLHKAQGYDKAREFTDEEKEKIGVPKEAMCGILGTVGLHNLPPFTNSETK
jgi:hypothetical protein